MTIRVPGHPRHPHALRSLGGILLARYDHSHDLQDLEESIRLLREAVNLFIANDAGRTQALNNLSCALMSRFRRYARIEDVDESVQLCHQTLLLLPEHHVDRPAALDIYAIALIARFRSTSHTEDLSEAIESYRAALDRRPIGHATRDIFLNNLAIALLLQYERNGSGDRQQHLQEAIGLQREVVLLRPPGHPDRASSIANLSSLVFHSFEATGNYQLLEQCLLLDQEALSLSKQVVSSRAQTVSQSSHHQHARFIERGQEDDLQAAIEMCRMALEVLPREHTDRPTYLRNLSVLLTTRYHFLGQLEDSDEVVELRREALHTLPASHVDYPLFLRSLADSLHDRYKRGGVDRDLHDSLELHRQALDRLIPEHSLRAQFLTNFAVAKCSLYHLLKKDEDLAEAGEFLREACSLFHNHIFYPRAVMNYTSVLYDEFVRKGQRAEDLQEPISLCDELLRTLPSDHSIRKSLRHMLSLLLCDCFLVTRDRLVYRRAFELQQALVADTPDGSPMRASVVDTMASLYLMQNTDEANFSSALTLLMEFVQDPTTTPRERVAMAISRLRDAESWMSAQFVIPTAVEEQLITAYKCTIDLLPQIAAFSLDTSMQLRALRKTLQVDDIITLGANRLIAFGRLEEAVEMLEASRAIVWSQALRLRTPVDDLHPANTQIADKLRSIGQQLRASSVQNQKLVSDDALSISPAVDYEYYYRIHDEALHSDREVKRRRELGDLFVRTLAEARSIPGFERLMLSENYESLSMVASGGPVVILVNQYALILTSSKRTPIRARVSVPKNELQKLRDVLNPRNTLQGKDPADSWEGNHLSQYVYRTQCFNS